MSVPERTTPARRSRRCRTISSVATAVFLGATAVAVTMALRAQNWHAMGPLWRPSAALVLVAALLLNLAGLGLSMISWRCLLLAMTGSVGLAASARIYFTGLIGSFLPGPLWAVLVHVRLGTAAGITAARMAAVYVASLPVGIFAGATVGLLIAPVLPGAQAVWLAVPAAAVLVCLVRPGVVHRLAAVMARTARRPRQAPVSVPDDVIRRSITANLLGWAVSGLHLWVILLLLGAPAGRSLPLCIGGFAVAVTVGGLAVFVPGGLGVRELVLSVLLATVLPWQMAVAATVASRIVIVSSEVLAAGIAMLAAWNEERQVHAS